MVKGPMKIPTSHELHHFIAIEIRNSACTGNRGRNKKAATIQPYVSINSSVAIRVCLYAPILEHTEFFAGLLSYYLNRAGRPSDRS